MIDKVPGTSTPFMRCGAAIADPALPAIKRETVEDFAAMLAEFFKDKPEALKTRIDEMVVRFKVNIAVYGGSFIGVLLHTIASTGILDMRQYDQWGISWFPTYADLLDLCRQFLASEAAPAAKAA